MQILIVGSGGREHALAWKIAQSDKVTAVFVAPGNAGTALERKVSNVEIDPSNIDALLQFAQEKSIDFTIVGPEGPLVNGIVDRFFEAGLHCFGPTKEAARLEGSKSFAKTFMKRNYIPTAHYNTFSPEEMKDALQYVWNSSMPVVIKADGLAAGKGVVIATTHHEASEAINKFLPHQNIVIEEFLTGEELSYIVMVDGQNIVPLVSSQDHKRRDEGDEGPNTGGMGAYSPSLLLTPKMEEIILNTIIKPTVKGMNEEGHTFRGFLYAGIIITEENQPMVLEYNCRLGDPETQVILPRLESDFIDLIQLAFEGRLNSATPTWSKEKTLGVVIAEKGYPETFKTGHVIKGLDSKKILDNPAIKVFQAGTKLKDDQIVTHGGRVLCVTAKKPTILEAQKSAYEAIKHIHWNSMYYRKDIGFRAILKEEMIDTPYAKTMQ